MSSVTAHKVKNVEIRHRIMTVENANNMCEVGVISFHSKLMCNSIIAYTWLIVREVTWLT